MFGVGDEVDQDLEDFPALGLNAGDGEELAHDVDIVAGEGADVHAEGVLHQLGGVEGLGDADHRGVGLLHDDDLADVIDVFLKPLDLGEEMGALFKGVGGEGGDELGDAAAFGIGGEKDAEVVAVFGEEGVER